MKAKSDNLPALALLLFICVSAAFLCSDCGKGGRSEKQLLAAGFINPPDSTRPGVYWYFMDGNISHEGMTVDLESMKTAGIGSVLFLEVNVGIPRGRVDFMSDEWLDLFRHARKEAERIEYLSILKTPPGQKIQLAFRIPPRVWESEMSPDLKSAPPDRHSAALHGVMAPVAHARAGRRALMRLTFPSPEPILLRNQPGRSSQGARIELRKDCYLRICSHLQRDWYWSCLRSHRHLRGW